MALSFIIAAACIASGLSFFVKKRPDMLALIAFAAALMELAATVVAAAAVVKNGAYASEVYFSVDSLGAILLILVAVIGLIVSWYSVGYLKAEVAKGIIGFRRVRQYFVLLHLFLFAMFFAVITPNPIVMWIAIEATTLSTAFLISFYNKPSAMEAAWKYLILNSVGLLLGFFGTLLFLYPALQTGQEGLITWHSIRASISGFDPFVAKIAFIFILIGYGTKMGLVPMHTWLPDAHSKAPVPISGLLSGVLLNIAFFAILRFKALVDLAVGPDFSRALLIFFGLTSILVSAFIIFIQKNYKRLLAYSSIEHMGVMALGFGFGGVGASAALLHMIYHSIAKSLLFLSAGHLFLKYSSTKIIHVQGVLSVLPSTGILFIIGFLAITGVPPFGIFITEFTILSAGIQTHPAVTVMALFGLTLVFIGFFRHTVAMLFGKNETGLPPGEAGQGTMAPVVVLALLLTITSIYVPSFIASLIDAASLAY